jgi:hypothetical protein
LEGIPVRAADLTANVKAGRCVQEEWNETDRHFGS